MNFLDFFVQLNNDELCIISFQKEDYLEASDFISNPISKSIFRPPIV
jgi:hypothetical protein